MDYQVWTKEDFSDQWMRVDCGDLEAAKREVEKAVRSAREPVLTQEVYYTVSIKLTEAKVVIEKDKTKPDKSPGVESKGAVRLGNTGPVPELSEGGGDPSPGDSVPSR